MTAEKTQEHLSVISWGWWFAYSKKFTLSTHNLIVSYGQDNEESTNFLNQKVSEVYNLSPSQYVFGQVGKLPTGAFVYRIESAKKASTKTLAPALKASWGVVPYNYDDLANYGDGEKIHPAFLPKHGCFGYINGQIILGSRHHMEIMYRLIENGWTWDQLLNATQLWGWYGLDSEMGTLKFSSDAGLMTDDKNKCCLDFQTVFEVPFKNVGGYGGKNKSTFGGNMKTKYGEPGNWTGHKTGYDNTVISPIPPPPEKEPSLIEKMLSFGIPGGGNPPPKPNKLGELWAS